MRTLTVERMGRVEFGRMHEVQVDRQHAVIEGRAPDTLFLLEHPPVVTLGKNTRDGHVLASSATLKDRKVEVHPTGRGGDVTFHGPGQLVGYPVIQLQEGEKDLRRFVSQVEELVIRVCADFGVKAGRVDGLRGIWVGRDKIGAVGIRVSRWTTLHGFALNVCTDLTFFDLIVPCGIRNRGVTSIEQLTGRRFSVEEVADCAASHAGQVFQRNCLDPNATNQPGIQRVRAS